MAKDKRVFTGGMDKDSEPRLIKQGDYRHAENIRNIASSDGTSGSVENIEGNKEVIHPFINENIFVAETVEDSFITTHEPERLFYSQEIHISGRENSGDKYNFSIFNYDENENLVFSGINLSWDGNDDFTSTASYLHSKFNSNDGTLRLNIPLINRANGEAITGHSEVFLQNTDLPFTPSTSMGFGASTLVIKITADVQGIDFDLDFKSSYSANPDFDLWIHTVNDQYTYGRFYIVDSQSLYLGSAAGFEETDEIPSLDDGSPVGLISDTEGESEDTQILLTFTGTLPSTPQDPIEELNIYSVVENEDGTVTSIPFAPDKLNFSADFNSGDPFELTGDLNELSEALVDKFTDLEADVLVPGAHGPTYHTLKTTNGNFVTGFDANTKLENRSRSIDYDFYVIKYFTTEADFTQDDTNNISGAEGVSFENNSIVLSEGFDSNQALSILRGYVDGKRYRLNANISTFSSSGNVLNFNNFAGSSTTITSTNSDFSFEFDGHSNSMRFFLDRALNEGESIVIQNLSVSEHREPVSSLKVLIRSNLKFNLAFSTDQQTAEDNHAESRTENTTQDFLNGVSVSIQTLSSASNDYNDLIDEINAQDIQIQELNDAIDSLQNQLNTLTEEYNNIVSTLNTAAALDSSTAYGTLTLLSDDLSNLNNVLEENNISGILSDLNTNIGDLNTEISDNQLTISNLNASLTDAGLELSALNNDLAGYVFQNENLQTQVASLTSSNTELEEQVLNLQNSVNNSIGSELVVNGTFDTDSDWTKEGTWTISGETANRTALSSGNELKQTFTTANNKNWLVSFEITSITEGGCGVRLNGSSVNSYYTKVGIYTEVFNGNGLGTAVIIQSDSSNPFAGSIDNVSVKEVSEDYVSLLNELAAAEDLLSTSEDALQNLENQILGSGLSLTDLISGYNSATDQLDGLVSSVQGMITTINNANFTNQELTDSLQNDIASLEGFIQAAVNAADSLGTDNIFNTIEDYSNALGTLQSDYTNLVTFITNLSNDVENATESGVPLSYSSINTQGGDTSTAITNLQATLTSAAAENLVDDINNIIGSTTVYYNNLVDALSSTPEDGVTQADVDAVQDLLDEQTLTLNNAVIALQTLQNAFPLTNLITHGDFTENAQNSVLSSNNWLIDNESIISQPTTGAASVFILNVNGDQTNGKYVLSFSLVHAHNVQVIIQRPDNMPIEGGGTFNAPLDIISESGFYTIEANLSGLEGSETIQVKFRSVNNYLNGGTIIDNISLVKVPDGVNINGGIFSDFADQINDLLFQVLTLDITTDNQAIEDEAYQLGFAAGVDNATPTAYAEGIASVDITMDNEAVYNAGFANGSSTGLSSVESVFSESVGYQLDIMNLLGLIEGLTGQTIGTLQGTVADAQVDIETIATTSAQDVLDATEEYEDLSGGIQSQIDALIVAAESLANSPNTTQTVHDTYTFVVYGDQDSLQEQTFSSKLYYKNEEISGYEQFEIDNYVVAFTENTVSSTISAKILSTCHNFANNDSIHEYSGSDDLIGHSHYKTIAIPNSAPAVLKLTIENFHGTTSLPGPDISNDDFQDDSNTPQDINEGLKFTVTVISGPSEWEFAVSPLNPYSVPISSNNILSDGIMHWNIIDQQAQSGTPESVGPNNLLTGTEQSVIIKNASGVYGSSDGFVEFDSTTGETTNPVSNSDGTPWELNDDSGLYSPTVNGVSNNHFVQSSVTLETNTVYQIEFHTWFHPYVNKGIKVDLGDNLTPQTTNTVIDDWGGTNMMSSNSIFWDQDSETSDLNLTGGLSYGNINTLSIRIRTGPEYNANVIRFSAANEYVGSSSGGFSGWLRNISIKKVNSVTSGSPAVDINLLGEKTSSASEQGRSLFLSPSRAYTGASRRIVKDPLKAATYIEPIVSLGYTCIGTYEDKPNNKLYYFVVNEEGTRKYDCILEYDLMTDSIETVYQDDRPSSNLEENNILNFSASHLITGVDKVDDILYFTDNLNRPRKINVELGKQNERNINNPKFIFKDFYYKSQVSTVFIGTGQNNHPFKAGDHIYAQTSQTLGNPNIIGINGYSEVLGIVRKPFTGITFTVSNGSSTITASSSTHGLDSFVGDFIGIQDGGNFPYYYQINSISGATIQLETNYVEGSVSSVTRNPVKFGDQNAVGIITDCPWPGSSTAVRGKILYADPSNVIGEEKAYSPLISYGSYHEKSKYFDVIKHQPEHRPLVIPDSNSSFATNNILDNLFQFKYRYLHVDEEMTSYSAISDINIDPMFALNSAVNAEDYNSMANMLNVHYEDTISDVDTIEIVARKGNDGEFFLVDTIQNDFIKHLKRLKNELIADSAFDYSTDDITSVIPFYNNGIYPFVDKSDSDKLFDAVPKLAKAQTILSNNRLAYGNVLEGYDNTKIVAFSEFRSDVNSSLTSSTQSLPTSDESSVGGWTDIDGELFDFGSASGNTKHTQKWYLGNLNLLTDRNQIINIDYSWVFEKETFGAGTINRNGSFNAPPYNASGITDIDFVGESLATHVLNRQFTPGGIGGTGTVSSSSYDSSTKLLQITFTYNTENQTAGISWGLIEWDKDVVFKPKNLSNLISGDLGLSSFKTGAFHNFGIAYFDETNRCSFVNAGPDYGVEINNQKINGTRPYNPFYTETEGPELSTSSRLTLEIYNKPPLWATNYQMYYTGNTTVDEFIQMTVVNVIAGTSNDKQMYLSLQSLKGENWSYNESTNSQLEYNFVKGDRVRFISFDPGNGRQKFTDYVDLEIAGDDLYVDGDEDSPIGTITSSTSGFYIRVNDPEQTAVNHSGGGTVSIAHTGFSLDGSGYEKLIVEIYRPKKTLPEESMVYYEIGDKRPIINAGKFNRSHSGDSSQNSDYSVNQGLNLEVSSVPAVLTIDGGDVYLKPRNMGTANDGASNETFFPEDYYLNDFHQTNHYSKGRVNVVSTNARERRLEASVYYSETYSSTASINGLSNFNLANSPYYDYNKDFGSIQSLNTKDTDLIIFHENKVGRVLVGKDILNTASGEGLVSLSTNVIDDYVSLYAGEYGCCIQPESVVKFNNKFYFVDIKRGAVLRLSADGLTVISDNGMRDYFRDIGEIYVMNDPENQRGSIFKIVAGYDAKYDEYIVTFPDIFSSKGRWSEESVLWDSYRDKFQNNEATKIYDAKTIAFNERTNRWTSFYTFYPEFYGRVGRQFIGFEEGRLFKHNLTDRYYTDLSMTNPNNYQNLYNNLYSTQYASTIQFPFNAEPSAVKAYNSITLEGDSKWFTSMYTNIGQTVQGPTNGFKEAYENTISTEIGYRRVDGLIQNFNENQDIAIIQGVNTKFFKDVKKGDIVKIYGVDSFGSYLGVLRIVRSVISNTILYLDDQINLLCDKTHMEVLDYKTKEGIHYSSIPFVSSMEEVQSTRAGYTFSGEDRGDGSEFFGVGKIGSYQGSSQSITRTFTADTFFDVAPIRQTIRPNQMIVGAEYLIYDAGDDDIEDDIITSVDTSGYGGGIIGYTFICEKSTNIDSGLVLSTDYKLYLQRLDGSTVFLGYPYSNSSSSISFVISNNYSEEVFNGFLFVVKDGKVEGEKMKGSYMMTTLSTDKDIPYKSKYKHNLYGASVDVDKSELSDK